MAYLRLWNSSTPAGTAAANTLHTVIENFKADIAERLADIFGLSSFTADPLRPTQVNLAGAPASKIIPGATSLGLRDSTDTLNNVLVAENGDVTVRGKLLSAKIGADLVMDAAHQATFNSPLDVIASQARVARNTPIAAAASQAIDWDLGNNQPVTLGNSTTLTFSHGKAGGWYMLEIKQTGAGSWTITWPASVVWPGGVAPTLTSTTGRSDFLSFYYNGTSYVGFVVGLNANV